MRRRQPAVRLGATAVALLAAAGCATGGVDASGPTTTAAPPISLDASPTSTTPADPSGKDVAGQVFGGRGEQPGAGAGGEGADGDEAAIGGSSEDVEQLLDRAGARTAAQATAAFSLTFDIDGADGHEDTMTLSTVTGEYRTADDATRTTSDLAGMFEYYPESSASEAERELLAEPIDSITIGVVAWAHSPGLEKLTGKPWAKIDLTTQTVAANPVVDLVRLDDMSTLLAWMRTDEEIERVGSEDVDGVATTRLHSDIAPSEIDATSGAGLGAMLAHLDEGDQASIELWIDDDGLVRRLELQLDASAMGTEPEPAYPGGTLTVRLQLSAFGEPVDIEAPAPDEVVDGSAVLGQTPKTAS